MRRFSEEEAVLLRSMIRQARPSKPFEIRHSASMKTVQEYFQNCLRFVRE